MPASYTRGRRAHIVVLAGAASSVMDLGGVARDQRSLGDGVNAVLLRYAVMFRWLAFAVGPQSLSHGAKNPTCRQGPKAPGLFSFQLTG